MSQVESNFGRSGMSGTGSGATGGMGGMFGGMFGGGSTDVEYVSEVSYAMNLTIVLQMIGIGLLLTLVAGSVAIAL